MTSPPTGVAATRGDVRGAGREPGWRGRTGSRPPRVLAPAGARHRAFRLAKPDRPGAS